MTDTARLQIRVETDGTAKATSQLTGLEKQSGRTEKATNKLASGYAMMATKVAGVVAVLSSLKSVINTTREWEKLRAVLKTVTKDVDKAALAWEVLQEFAKTTPYNLEQSITAFNKLVSMGLTPSEQALRAYGNTAAAMGKDLNQMIEAVADAAVGEFERLKEFGIKARNQGDTIRFTFQGVTTEVKNSAADIEKYLIGIGEVNFAGAMADRMATLDGALNNLGDSWNSLTQAMMETGPSDAIEFAVRAAIDALDELTAMIQSGQMAAYIDAFVKVWVSGFGSLGDAVSDFTLMFSDNSDLIGDIVGDIGQFIGEAFLTLPQNIKIVWSGAMLGVVKSLNTVREAAYQANVAYEQMFGDTESVKEAKLALINYRIEAAELEHQMQLNAIASVEERDVAIKNFDDQIAKAKALREEWEKNKKARLESTKLEDLVPTVPGATGENSGSGGDSKEFQNKQKEKDRWLQQVMRYNMTESELNDAWREDELAKLKQFVSDKVLLADEEGAARAEIEAKWRANKAALDEAEAEKLREAQATQLMAYSSMFGDLGDLAKTFAGEQSGIYQTLFAASKAYSIASVMVSSYDAIAKAWSSAPFPYNLPAVATATVETGALKAAVSAVTLPGRAHGGRVTGGSTYRGAERGLELFKDDSGNMGFIPPADGKVIPAHQVDKELASSSGTSSGSVGVTIVNLLDPNLLSDYLDSRDGEETIINVISRNQTDVKTALES